MLEEVREYYENKELESIYYINNNGDRHGISIKYWKNGNIFLKSSYNNGIQCGYQISYDQNKKIFYIISYKKFQFNGPFIEFNY